MSLLSNYTEILNFVEEELNKIVISTKQPNIKAAATLLAVTIDHAQGIRFLLEKGAYPSAVSLMRVIFETFIRAMWLWKCANEKQVDTFINKDKIISTNGKPIHFKDLVKDVEVQHKLPAYLSKIQTNVWSGLNSLTHSGSIQLANNFNGKTICHSYNDELVDEVIEFSTMLTCFAFSGVLDLANNKNKDLISDTFFQKIKPWAFNNLNEKDS